MSIYYWLYLVLAGGWAFWTFRMVSTYTRNRRRNSRLVIAFYMLIMAAGAMFFSSCHTVKRQVEKLTLKESLEEKSRVIKSMEERARTIIEESIDTTIYRPQMSQRLVVSFPEAVNPLFPALRMATIRMDSLNLTLYIQADSANRVFDVTAVKDPEKIPVNLKRKTTMDKTKTATSDSSGHKKQKKKLKPKTKHVEKEPDYSWILWLAGIITGIALIIFGLPRLKRKLFS